MISAVRYNIYGDEAKGQSAICLWMIVAKMVFLTSLTYVSTTACSEVELVFSEVLSYQQELFVL